MAANGTASGAVKRDITVAVVPREKFSYAPKTLDAVLANSTLPFNLLYVDGNSPRKVADAIRTRLEGRPNTRLLRFEKYLGPIHSRIIAANEADPSVKYLVILDNDVLVRPGWLEALYRCAEEEDAGAVVPLVLIGGPDTDMIHHAGGETEIRRTNDAVELFYRQHLEDYRAADVEDQLTRRQTLLLEDHCILARTELWKSLAGGIDERIPLMTSVPELSFRFQKSGAKLMFEPAARVVYLWGEEVPLAAGDIATWYLAWSERWSRHYMRRFANDYGLSVSRDEDRRVVWWLGNHRRSPMFPLFSANRRLFQRLHLPFVGKMIEKVAERVEDVAALVIAEAARRTRAGRNLGCPSILSPYPRLTRGDTNGSTGKL
jgi:GT2 family glycosyltransferase